jgi:hypothetical protein
VQVITEADRLAAQAAPARAHTQLSQCLLSCTLMR